MLISVPPGYVLTSDNRLIPGGPQMIIIGPGQTMDSGGRIYDNWPKIEPAPVQPAVPTPFRSIQS